jgi:hypothetical protein
VAERSVRDVERAPSDVTIGGDQGDSQTDRLNRGDSAAAGPRKRGRRWGFAMFGALKKSWIAIVILVVVVAGGMTVARLHGIFGSEKRPAYADTKINDNKPFDPKRITYEIFGSPGSTADIGYFDANSEPQRVEGVHLPWTLVITTTKPTIVGNLVAQGTGDQIGCRILVGSDVKAEKVTNEVAAFTYCMLKSA